MKIIFLILVAISSCAYSQSAVIVGIVKDKSTSTPLQNCNIIISKISAGAASNEKGEFMIPVPIGAYEIQFKYVGYAPITKKVNLKKENEVIFLEVELTQESYLEKEALVIGDRINSTAFAQTLQIKDISKMPILFSDPLKSVKLLSGAIESNEMSNSFSTKGGGFDENIVILNGYEIQRPLFLREGIEEAQSLANGDMVEELIFFSGGFPARYGGKMSSALDIKYKNKFESRLGGILRADFTNSSASFYGKEEFLNWVIGARKAYPESFMRTLQTDGEYSPDFYDGQFLLNYELGGESYIELFGVKANNTFTAVPKVWKGHFRVGENRNAPIDEIKIIYDGYKEYIIENELIGLRTSGALRNYGSFEISVSYSKSKESETIDLDKKFYYQRVNSGEEENNIFNAKEYADNNLRASVVAFDAKHNKTFGEHFLEMGFIFKINSIKFNSLENYEEIKDTIGMIAPAIEKNAKWNIEFNSFGFYIQDDYNFSKTLFIQFGARFGYNSYTRETYADPRAGVRWKASEKHLFRFNCGRYSQPPARGEFLTDSGGQRPELFTQKSDMYSAVWEYFPNYQKKISIEIFYKNLKKIAPFYIDQNRIIYASDKTFNGYAYGFDFQYDGNLSKNLRSAMGYSFLNSRERNAAGGEYVRRIFDQTHTIRIFLQDRSIKFADIRSCLNIYFGGGILFNMPSLEFDPTTEMYLIKPDLEKKDEYMEFFRVDLSVIYNIKISDALNCEFKAEALNLFDKRNYFGYEWVQPYRKEPWVVKVPQLLSRRFYNLGFALRF